MTERFLCCICKDVIVSPNQGQCGCRFCEKCINKHVTSCYCPGCGVNVNKWQLIYDKAVENEIADLEMSCLNKNCINIFKVRNLSKHLIICEFQEEQCVKCDEFYIFTDKEKHEKRDCKMRSMKCQDCGSLMAKYHYDDKHKNVKYGTRQLCSNWNGICPLKCSEDIQENVKMHLLSSCNESNEECSLKEIGCDKVIIRKEMNDHMNLEVRYHIDLLTNEIYKLQHKTMHISEIIEANRTLVDELKDMKEKLNTIDFKYPALKGELNTNSQITITEGEVTWQIKNFITKITNAKRGLDQFIFSDPFYSREKGYKMCLKVYPYGDGSGLGSHMSLFFVIMKGEYDDNLSWPFSKNIMLKLKKISGKMDLVFKFKPTQSPACYGKPTSKYNVASGQPKFISHVELISTHEFLHDDEDTIIIQAIIL
jgi:hypothetical protein